MRRRLHPTPQTLCCVVCGEILHFEDETKTSAGKLARLTGWSESKYGWLCNWDAKSFAPKDKSNELRAAFDLHSEYRPRREYVFDRGRGWQVDFAFPHKRLAIEVEGGVWTNGRHTRGAGFIEDMTKYNALTLNGWRLLRYTPQMIKRDPLKVIKEIEQALELSA